MRRYKRYQNDDGCLYSLIFGVISIVVSLIFKLNIIVAFAYILGAASVLALLLAVIAIFIKKLGKFFKRNNKYDSNKTTLNQSKGSVINLRNYKEYRTYTVSRNSIYSENNFYLYHFTHPDNIPSIKKYGLLSWHELMRKNILHMPASNDLSRNLDRRYNLEDYIRLSLKPEHPMFQRVLREGRVDKLIWLKIDPKVINFPNTLFSNDNATNSRAIINGNKNTTFKSHSSQAEVLIKRYINPKYIYFS